MIENVNAAIAAPRSPTSRRSPRRPRPRSKRPSASSASTSTPGADDRRPARLRPERDLRRRLDRRQRGRGRQRRRHRRYHAARRDQLRARRSRRRPTPSRSTTCSSSSASRASRSSPRSPRRGAWQRAHRHRVADRVSLTDRMAEIAPAHSRSVSVLIPVRNGGEDLRRCLEAISRAADRPRGRDRRRRLRLGGRQRRARPRARRPRPRDRARRLQPRRDAEPRRRAGVGRDARLHHPGRVPAPASGWLERLVAPLEADPAVAGRLRAPAPARGRERAGALLPRLPLRAAGRGPSG